MTKDTNIQHAASLRKLADIYESAGYGDGPAITQNGLYIFIDTKQELLDVIRAIGGRFTKEFSYEKMILQTSAIPGLRISIERNKVCRAVTTYDCDPVFSPDDEREIDAELLSSSAAGA